MTSDVEIIISQLSKIPGGYIYSGVASYQICFPLKAGGELRFSISDVDIKCNPSAKGTECGWNVDFYDGSLPPCITGFSNPTAGEKKDEEVSEA